MKNLIQYDTTYVSISNKIQLTTSTFGSQSFSYKEKLNFQPLQIEHNIVLSILNSKFFNLILIFQIFSYSNYLYCEAIGRFSFESASKKVLTFNNNEQKLKTEKLFNSTKNLKTSNGPTACGCIPGPNVYIIDNPNQLITQTNIPPTLSGGAICINGKLRINRFQNLINVNILISGGSSIEIDAPYVLTVAQICSFNSCNNTMWKGIKVKSGAGLRMSSPSFISNALFGIEAEQGSRLIDISYVTFDRDFIGIYFPGGDIPVASIRGNIFSSSNTLLSPHSSFPNNFVYGDWPLCGIYIKDVPLISIDYGNQFDNLNNGIIIENSSCNIVDNFFNSLKGTNFISSSTDQINLASGNGVIIKNSVSTKIYGNDLYLQNQNAIAIINSNVKVESNGMNNCNVGVKMFLEDFRKVTLEHCSIFYNNIGVDIQELNNSMDLSIVECDFYGTPSCNAGIQVSSVPILALDAQINNCNFNSTYGDGIRLNNAGNFIVTANDIYLNSSLSQSSIQNGIIHNFSNSNYISDNQIFSAANLGNTTYGSALNNQFSDDNKFCCNSAFGTAKGILFTGDADNTKLIGSYFEDNKETSLQIEENTYISEQLHHANYFPLISAPIEALHLGENEDVKKSRFFVRYDIDDFFPDPLSTPNSQVDWFVKDPYNIIEQECFPCIKYVRSKGLWTPNTGALISSTDLEIVKPEAQSYQYNEGRSWNSKMFLYGKLVEFEELIGSNSSIDSFYTVTDTSIISDYYYVRKDLRELFQLDQVQRQINANFRLTLDSILTYSQLVDSMIKEGGDDSLMWISIRSDMNQSMNSVTLSYKNHSESIKTSKNVIANGLLINVNNLAVTNQAAMLEKRISQLYLKAYINGITALTSGEQFEVSNLSNICRHYNKYAIAFARGLNKLINPTFIYNDTLLCEPTLQALISSTKQLSSEDYLIDIYPNPCIDIATLVNSSKYEIIRLRAIQFDGKVIEIPIQLPQKINLSMFETGTYILQAFFKDGHISSKKFCIK
ncbi:MAG: right-handed parallel beta-helix repeat-containing protein [Saprospiraceae bacterium]